MGVHQCVGDHRATADRHDGSGIAFSGPDGEPPGQRDQKEEHRIKKNGDPEDETAGHQRPRRSFFPETMDECRDDAL